MSYINDMYTKNEFRQDILDDRHKESVMDTDGNLEALRRHEAEVDKEEAAYEAMNDELMTYLASDVEELRELHKQITEKYGFTNETFCQFVESM